MDENTDYQSVLFLAWNPFSDQKIACQFICENTPISVFIRNSKQMIVSNEPLSV
jgi:hypothetical protein